MDVLVADADKRVMELSDCLSRLPLREGDEAVDVVG